MTDLLDQLPDTSRTLSKLMEVIFEYENDFIDEFNLGDAPDVYIDRIYFDSRNALVKYDINGRCSGKHGTLIPLLDVVIWADK